MVPQKLPLLTFCGEGEHRKRYQNRLFNGLKVKTNNPVHFIWESSRVHCRTLHCVFLSYQLKFQPDTVNWQILDLRTIDYRELYIPQCPIPQTAFVFSAVKTETAFTLVGRSNFFLQYLNSLENVSAIISAYFISQRPQDQNELYLIPFRKQ